MADVREYILKKKRKFGGVILKAGTIIDAYETDTGLMLFMCHGWFFDTSKNFYKRKTRQ